jgi:Ankyrin repeats (many copies)
MLVEVMIQRGPQATFMKDSKGYLPLHAAASLHVSPSKLRLLLDANPLSIFEKTGDGKTALDLAKATATATRPHHVLIKALQKEERKYSGRVNSLQPQGRHASG